MSKQEIIINFKTQLIEKKLLLITGTGLMDVDALRN